MTPGDIKSIYGSVFIRRGMAGKYTGLFDDLELSTRSSLYALLDLRIGELPIIGSFDGSSTWLVVTTERLIWSIDGKSNELSNQVINDATIDLKLIQSGLVKKSELRTLQVSTLINEKYTIEVESGEPLNGILNVLQSFGRRKRSQQSE